MRRVCFYHAGCPDGFGAAWAVWRAWREDGEYLPRGHDDSLRASDFEGAFVAFVDIAPPNESLRELGLAAARVVVLDHHVTSRDRYESEPGVENTLRGLGHHVEFDLSHSGAVLAWLHFHPGEEVPELLRYVEDQDLWNWALPRSEEVNAALGSYPQRFRVWSELAKDVPRLADEGEPILRGHRLDAERALRFAHPVRLGDQRVEAVNALYRRSFIGHELAKRAAFGLPVGLLYRASGNRVDVSLYSVGSCDVSKIAARYGGGGHPNAAGFHVTLRDWLDQFVLG